MNLPVRFDATCYPLSVNIINLGLIAQVRVSDVYQLRMPYKIKDVLNIIMDNILEAYSAVEKCLFHRIHKESNKPTQN